MSLLLPKKSLILLVSETRCDPQDFEDIAQKIRAQATDVVVQVLTPDKLHKAAKDTWNRPTLAICLTRIPKLSMTRGKIIMSRPISKLQQAEMMKIGGIPTPHVELYRFGMTFDEAIWGQHVVLKPQNLRFTSKGAGLEIIATEKLSGMREQDFPPDHFAHHNKMLVQRFIDTGPQPTWYRACTFIGEPLYIIKAVAKIQKDGANVPKNFHSKGEIQSYEFEHYPRIQAFARKVATCFANSPLLGCDILEEHGTGKLYALEVNAGGNVWHFSSPFNAEDRRKNPEYNTQRLNQYNAFDVAAKALINATRRLAV
jgi:hypothetical protein